MSLWHFASLDGEQQAQVVHSLALYGHDERQIAELTGFSPELVCRLLARRAELA